MSEGENNKGVKTEEGAPPENAAHTSLPAVRSSSTQTYNRVFAGASDDETPPALWLITFTDVVALMLTFFVLLYSMSVPQEEKWEDVVDSLSSGLSKFYSPPENAGPQDTISILKIERARSLDLKYLREILERGIAENEHLKNVVMINQSDRLIVSLPQAILFEGGKTSIGTQGKRALFGLGGLLSRIRNRIEIVGHADPRPSSSSSEYSSNWSLSLARAGEVARLLREFGYSRDIMIRGLSSARYDELSNGLNEEERLSLSRRVDIVIMQDNGRRKAFFEFGN
ncbi:MAG: flagellar motor protein MotB [Alphaproteobacteria bacterium]